MRRPSTVSESAYTRKKSALKAAAIDADTLPVTVEHGFTHVQQDTDTRNEVDPSRSALDSAAFFFDIPPPAVSVLPVPLSHAPAAGSVNVTPQTPRSKVGANIAETAVHTPKTPDSHFEQLLSVCRFGVFSLTDAHSLTSVSLPLQRHENTRKNPIFVDDDH
jgi:hypothetical protein